MADEQNQRAAKETEDNCRIIITILKQLSKNASTWKAQVKALEKQHEDLRQRIADLEQQLAEEGRARAGVAEHVSQLDANGSRSNI